MSEVFITNLESQKNQKGDNVIYPFGPPIFQTFVEKNNIDLLLNEGRNLKEKDLYSDSLAGNLKNGNSYVYNEHFTKNFQFYVLSKIEDWFNIMIDNGRAFAVKRFMEIYDENKNTFVTGKLILTRLWINFQKINDFNPIHSHSGDLSFVIYLKVPKNIFSVNTSGNYKKAGLIEFLYGEPVSYFDRENFTVQPSEGLMLIFPAKLQHFVPPFWVDEERISVSGNLSVVSKQNV